MATVRPSGEVVRIGGRAIPVTNLDKVLYPATGTTKGDVIAYYAQIAPLLIPHAEGRPATRKRWVHGVGTADEPGEVFFVKDLERGAPDWITRAVQHHSDGDKTYPIIDDAATLVWLAQLAALEIHVPQWRFGRDGTPKHPDRIVFDLDPGEGAGLAECVEVARMLRPILDGMGLPAVPVTSGSKGIHLYAPLPGTATSEQISEVAHELAKALEADRPDLVISSMRKADRRGKVLVDWSQNNGKKTTVCPYSLRGREAPTVAVPRTWAELDDPDLAQLDLHDVLDRMRGIGDPMAGLESGRSGVADERLATYRSMRDPARTPEPVPAAGVRGDAAPSSAKRTGAPPRFVIQEHHASRLHYDVRLEHEGVYVSWAVPKGLPALGGPNHLAVHTEDHPLEYGDFEGEIPAGEYGAGTVAIWDHGTYDLEKWREGDEVMVVLHGTRDDSAAQRYVFIATGARSGAADAADQWLLHRMQPGAAHRGGSPKSKARYGSARQPMSAEPSSEAE